MAALGWWFVLFVLTPQQAFADSAIEPGDVAKCRLLKKDPSFDWRGKWKDVADFCEKLENDPIAASARTTEPKLVRSGANCQGMVTFVKPEPTPVGEQPSEAQQCLAKCEKVRADAVELGAECTRFAYELLGGQGAATPGPSVSALLLGTTDFFVGRAKAELELWVKDQIAEELCPDDTKSILPELLVDTCAAIRPSAAGQTQFTLAAVTSAFRSDASKLAGRLLGVLLARLPPAKLGALGNPLRCLLPPLANALSDYAARGAINLPALAATLPTDETSDQCKEIHATALRAVATKVFALAQEPTDGATIRGALAQLATELELSKPDKLAPWQRLRWEQLQSAAHEWGAAYERKPMDGEKGQKRLRDATVALVQETIAFTLSLSLSEKDFLPVFANIKAVTGSLQTLLDGDYALAIVRLLSAPVVDDLLGEYPALAQIARHGQLLGSLASAKNPEEVEKALEAAAAPLTSYREFRRRNGAGFLGALLGVAPGAEIPFTGGTSSFTLAVMLPIGLEVGASRLGPSSSFQLFFSAIDLGNLATVRIDGETDLDAGEDGAPAAVPEPAFEAVVSPGVFGVFGLGNSPAVVALGVEIAPFGRQEFDCAAGVASCSKIERVAAARVMAMIAVDLPVLPLF